MKHDKKSYVIGALGLTESELKVLGSMATLTKARAEGCYVVNAGTDITESDIVIVNADDRDAVVKWRTLAVTPHPPVMVLYTREPPMSGVQHYLLRPFGPAKLLALLDGIAGELRASAEIWKKPAAAQQVATPSTGVQLQALVVDDSPTVRKQLELELRNFNVHTDCVETGEEGLTRLASSRYDLIFLDVVLPGTDGYQVCKEIRKNPKTKQTPVIMLTSKSSPFDRVRGSLVGCSAYLTKPVDYNNFREVVGNHIKTSA